MAGTFAYTESTNTVEVTDGTSGTPADFASFVTADRAGTATDLLIAGSPASDLALTYAVRPVEDLAILVKCIVANKTAHTDYIFITGTDWRGAAQTESIDVSAGNGSYTTTKYWASITTLDCSDNSAGGGTVWADGDLSVTQDVWGVIWDYGGGQYRLDCYPVFGDSSTSTYFQSKEEMVNMVGYQPEIKAAATLTIGTASNEYSKQGSSWRFSARGGGDAIIRDGVAATLNIYGSTLHFQDNFLFLLGGDITIKNSIIYITGNKFVIFDANTDVAIDGLYVTQNDGSHGASFGLRSTGITSYENIHTEDLYAGCYSMNVSATVAGIHVTNAIFRGYMNSAHTLILLDPVVAPTGPSDVYNNNAGSEIHADYTCNIHVADSSGANLATVNIDCDSDAEGDVFDVNTDANGDIAEQQIQYKKWVGTDETETAYSPHTFTISKAGYETLVLEAITVDGPINWHLELQDETNRMITHPGMSGGARG